MAHAGQVIENPLWGERITFRKTAADTGGQLLAIDLELSPGARMPAGLRFDEREMLAIATLRTPSATSRQPACERVP
jgi:hypothetical protein